MLLDLVESQEGIFRAELSLERIKEDLVLSDTWFALPERLMNAVQTTLTIRN